MSGRVNTRAVHDGLRRIRRRAWLAIALCFAFRAGEAALEASESPRVASPPHTTTMPLDDLSKEIVQ